MGGDDGWLIRQGWRKDRYSDDKDVFNGGDVRIGVGECRSDGGEGVCGG